MNRARDDGGERGSADGRPRPSWLGRVLFGGPLAVSAGINLVKNDEKVEAGRENGLPLPEVLVPLGSVVLLVGSVGVALWRRPAVAASSVAAFLAVATPTYHDFWNESGEERVEHRQAFENNVAIVGAALLLVEWAIRERT